MFDPVADEQPDSDLRTGRGLQAVLGHAETLLDAPQLVVPVRARSLENPGSRNPSPVSVSKYKVLRS